MQYVLFSVFFWTTFVGRKNITLFITQKYAHAYLNIYKTYLLTYIIFIIKELKESKKI